MGISGMAGGVCSVSSATGRGHGQWCQPMGHGETGKTWPWGWGCWQSCWGGVVHVVQKCCTKYTRAHLPQKEPGCILCPCCSGRIPLPRLCTSWSSSHHGASQCLVLPPSMPSHAQCGPRATPNQSPCGCHLPHLCTQDHPWAPQGKIHGLPFPSQAGQGCHWGRRFLEGPTQVGQVCSWGNAHPSCRCPLPRPCCSSCLLLPRFCAGTLRASFLFCLHLAALQQFPLHPHQPPWTPHPKHLLPPATPLSPPCCPEEPPAPGHLSPVHRGHQAVPRMCVLGGDDDAQNGAGAAEDVLEM